MQSVDVREASGAGHAVHRPARERVQVVDAEIVTRDGIRAGLCGGCGGTFDSDQMIELTLRSTRPAEVRALLHGTCALTLLEHTQVDLTAARRG